jgi:hypothetical protein
MIRSSEFATGQRERRRNREDESAEGSFGLRWLAEASSGTGQVHNDVLLPIPTD